MYQLSSCKISINFNQSTACKTRFNISFITNATLWQFVKNSVPNFNPSFRKYIFESL